MSDITTTEATTNERELTFLQRLARLLSVKSLVTLIFVVTYAYMTIVGKSVDEQFASIMLMIIGFYFGTQAKKE